MSSRSSSIPVSQAFACNPTRIASSDPSAHVRKHPNTSYIGLVYLLVSMEAKDNTRAYHNLVVTMSLPHSYVPNDGCQSYQHMRSTKNDAPYHHPSSLSNPLPPVPRHNQKDTNDYEWYLAQIHTAGSRCLSSAINWSSALYLFGTS